MLRHPPWLVHPITVFVFSILALGLSLFLYIYWYIEVSAGLRSVVRRFKLDQQQVFEPQTWVVILILSLLVGIILLGIFTIFVYSQKALQLYRLQNNFINSFTHELKTPVTSLKLFLETLMRHELPGDERKRYVGYMLADVGRLNTTIHRILELARIESKSYVGEFVATDLDAATRRFFDSHQTMFQAAEVGIAPTAGDGPTVCIDRGLFDMVLMNLTTNALTYTTAERPTLSVAVGRQGRWAWLRVTDNGIGMTPSERRRVFRKFYQAGRADNMTARGTGLGLYLVHQIARMHQGRVTAESPGPGRGSTFTVLLPAVAGERE